MTTDKKYTKKEERDYSVIEPNDATGGSKIADIQKYLKSDKVREKIKNLESSGLLDRIKENRKKL